MEAISKKISFVDESKSMIGDGVFSSQTYPPSVFYKAECIDFYLKKYKCLLITNEFRYGINQLITDLVLLTPRNTVSIEIKTEQDDLRRIETQISESRKHFNLTIVFAALKHKDELLSILPLDVGITIFNCGRCQIIRSPKRNTPIISEIVASIPAVFLRNYFKINSHFDSDKVRLTVLENHSSRINECFSNYLKHKFAKNYMQFLCDRGEQTHVEDISTLTMKGTIEIN